MAAAAKEAADNKNDSGYLVTGALIQVYDEGGRVIYLHHGAGVPSYVSADELKRLEDLNLIGKPKAADAPIPATVPRAVDL